MKHRLLLDTNVLIWSLSASDKISSRARRAILRPEAAPLVSLVSVWEIVMKHQAQKLHFKRGLRAIVDDILSDTTWTMLNLTPSHMTVLAGLPTLHKDPFDRLLIAQAIHEGIAIVTADEQIRNYDVKTIW